MIVSGDTNETDFSNALNGSFDYRKVGIKNDSGTIVDTEHQLSLYYLRFRVQENKKTMYIDYLQPPSNGVAGLTKTLLTIS